MAFEWYVLFILGNFVRNHSNKEKKRNTAYGIHWGGNTFENICVEQKSPVHTATERRRWHTPLGNLNIIFEVLYFQPDVKNYRENI